MPDTNLPSLPSIGDIPTRENACVVWHCRHLRTTDHPALSHATQNYDTVLPLFIFDPSFYGTEGLSCDSRIQFMHESLEDLNTQYEEHSTHLTYAHGDPLTILERFHDNGWDITTTIDPTGRYGLRRDNTAAEQYDVTFVAGDGLVRESENTRENWSEHAENWFTTPFSTTHTNNTSFEHIETTLSPDTIAEHYDITPTKQDVPRGGRTAAQRRLKHFTRHISTYPESISAPSNAETGTSRLSAYLRFGCLSLREVYQHVDANAPDAKAKDMFFSRLYWNRHYNQKLADWPGWMDTAVNPVMEGFHENSHNPELVEAWKHGQTGYPMVDASMRCLKQTGWLNFRMRAMCASFFCDLLQQPWKIGADWFYYHLIDADPAINYTQFQNQAGMVGVSMMRVYNPRKQVRDNDPDGEFICKWVPELKGFPTQYLDNPQKAPVHVQHDCGISIGENYPYPIIEYEQARRDGLDKLAAKQDAARKALSHPEVARRASLARQNRSNTSTKREPDTTEHSEKNTSTQQSLDSFTS